MSKKTTDPLGHLTGPGAEAFRFWISLWPVAPMFGVEWRFQGMFPGMPGMPGAPAADPRGGRARASAPPDTSSSASARSATGERAAAAPQPAATRAPAPAAAAEPRQKPAESPLAAAPEPAAKTAPRTAPKAEAPEPNVLPFGKSAEKPAHDNGARAEAPQAEAEAGDVAGVRPASLLDTAPGEADDLKMIKGIGPGLESQLNALGIYRFDQIAGFSEDELVWVNENLTSFKGRCFRDDWVGQAKDLLG